MFIALVFSCAQQVNTQHLEGMESRVSFITMDSCISHFKITFPLLFFVDAHVEQRKYSRSYLQLSKVD